MKKLLISLLIISQCFTNSFAESNEMQVANLLAKQGIISNTNNFRIEETITRKEVMKIVMNLSEKPVSEICSGMFSDVPNDWGCKYIETALEHGFIALNENFRPDDNITKTEAMKLVLKAKGVQKSQNTNNWQADYMMTAFEYRIINAMYTDYNENATRGWIFSIATALIENEDEIYEKGGIISDEAEVN